MSVPAILEPLRHRDFRLLWIGQTFSRLGDSAYAVALPLQVLAIGGSPLQLGIAFARTNPGLCTAVNQALADLQASGCFDTLRRRWFGEPQ